MNQNWLQTTFKHKFCTDRNLSDQTHTCESGLEIVEKRISCLLGVFTFQCAFMVCLDKNETHLLSA